MAATVETFDVALGEDMEKVWADKFIQKVFEQKWREWQVWFFDGDVGNF